MWYINDDWIALQIDVRTAFLYGDLEEEIYMRIPIGMDISEEYCLLLKKSIYGLVQAARQWYIKLIKFLKEYEYER